MRRQVIIAVLVFGACMLLIACGPSEAEREAQETAIAANIFATQTAEAPTATPTPTLTPTPSLIPGISEPVTLEERGIEFLIVGADSEVGQEAGHTELILKFGPPFDFADAEWIAQNSQLTCGTTSYRTRSLGFTVGDTAGDDWWWMMELEQLLEHLEDFRLIFDVPEDINLLECNLQVTDGIEIPLASLPESDLSDSEGL